VDEDAWLEFEFVGKESFKLSARNGFLLRGIAAGNIYFARDFGRVKNSHSVAITMYIRCFGGSRRANGTDMVIGE
jgi:hypothetical protein